ncbi:MAG: DUF512 domain-containing protein [Armatimonadetes bacterium]|nr:DUF512 domain-containing protein [Armatimonadota bacterium]
MEDTHIGGAAVVSVASGSLAETAGIQPGDVVSSVNGQGFNDLIEYRFLVADAVLDLDLARAGARLRVRIEKDEDEGLGITFADPVFDGIRKCRNSCVFCFIHQMPRGMRETLYVEDDDFRLSITHGSYVTLTNMSEADFQRILSLHLSPLHVSVHATDAAVRIRVLRNKRAGQILPLMRRLADGGIEMHCQIVLCPGYNDGAVLDRTLADLAEYWPSVLSVAVVPVGLTRFRERLTPIRAVDGAFARETALQIEAWRARFRERLGTRFVFPADELYLAGGVEIPPRAAYEDFPQTEDGIGLARLFLDELERVRRRKPRPVRRPKRLLLVTGSLAHPMVAALADEASRLTGHRVEALAVPNRFFGESITVAGLLTARDIIQAVRAAGACARVYVPSVLLKGDRFLDDETVSGMAAILGAEVRLVAPSPLALARELLDGRRRRPRTRCPESRGEALYIGEAAAARPEG